MSTKILVEFVLDHQDAKMFFTVYRTALWAGQGNSNSVGLCLQFETEDSDLAEYISESMALNELRVVNIAVQSYMKNVELEADS